MYCMCDQPSRACLSRSRRMLFEWLRASDIAALTALTAAACTLQFEMLQSDVCVRARDRARAHVCTGTVFNCDQR
jgi:hypothetical protein